MSTQLTIQQETRSLDLSDYKVIFHAAADGMFISDLQGNYLEVNQAGCDLLGYSRSDLLRMNLIDLLPQEDISDSPIHFEELLSGKTIVIRRRLKHKSGRLIEVEISAKKLSCQLLLGIVRDLSCRKRIETELQNYREHLEALVALRTEELERINTALREEIAERKRIEKHLRESKSRLRDLTLRLAEAQETERKELAREIHDDLGQRLTLLKMDLEWLMDHIRPENPAIQERLQRCAKLIHETSERVRSLAHQLRPSMLDHLGFSVTLQAQLADFQERTGIGCQCRLPVKNYHIPDFIAINLLRITQEALTNILRHARASRVHVLLDQNNSAIVLQIRDNGCGIEPEALVKQGSLGLLGMRERVRSMKGDFTIKGEPGQGTILTVRIPYSREGGAQ